jgi:hypothetical protein
MPRRSWSPLLAGGLCAVYALVHVWWAVAGAPAFLGRGESPLPGGWVPVVPAAVAAVLLGVLAGSRVRTRATRIALAAGAAAGGLGMLAYCLLAWIDLTMVLMAAFGVPMADGEVGALVVRVAGAVGGALAVGAARAELRSAGVRLLPAPTDRTPAWGWAAALLAVAGLAARLVPEVPRWADQGIVGPGGAGFLVFVGLLLLAGTALPLLLVTPWGRAPWLPRWLVLGPALFVGCGLLAYFGVGGFGAMGAGLVPVDRDALLMIGGYTVWGVGLLVAALSYAATTAQPSRWRR